KFRKCNNVRLQLDSAADPFGNLFRVAGNITDNNVDLRHRKPQRLLHGTYRNRWGKLRAIRGLAFRSFKTLNSAETHAPQGFEHCVTNYLQNGFAMFQCGLPW